MDASLQRCFAADSLKCLEDYETSTFSISID